jgi:putative nucleotidyltransferase with HDIG domain
MLLRQQPFYESLTARWPGLVERVRRAVEQSERKFTGAKDAVPGHLWEHTVLVASLAFRLAGEEKESSELAAVAALFHDAGKFSGGRYHRDDRAEEEEAARLGREILAESGMKVAEVGHIVRALRSLYLSGARRGRLSDIVHDADFLAKFGLLGVAGFFVKATLRGRNLESAIMNCLSKELTYAAVLPANMRTASGRKLAVRKSADTLRFYKAFLGELKQAHGLDFRIRKSGILRAGKPGRRVEVQYVLPAVCGTCGGAWQTDFRTDKGLKCEKLEASIRCASCGGGHLISFCIPEIA